MIASRLIASIQQIIYYALSSASHISARFIMSYLPQTLIRSLGELDIKNLNLTMMRSQSGVRSQPKLLARHKNELVAEAACREQLRMPEKLASIKYLAPSYNSHNKENDCQAYLNKLEEANARKVKAPTPTKTKTDTGNYKKDEAVPTPRSRKGYGADQLMGLGSATQAQAQLPGFGKEQSEVRKCEFQQMQEKVKDLENKILKIKYAIERRPERKAAIPTSSLVKDTISQVDDQQRTRSRNENIKTEASEPTSYTSPTSETQKPSSQAQQKAQTTIMSNFVTQVPAPSQLIQCSSQTNLFSSARHFKPSSNKYYVSPILSAYLDKSSNTSFTQLCRNHLLTSLQLFRCVKSIEKPRDVQPSKQLKKSSKLNTLIFDLDETLIHCNQSPDHPCDVLLPIVFPNGQGTKAGINIRPYAVECIKELAEHFELIVFTASHQCYGNVVVDYLDPKRQYISHRYFRDSCYKSPEGFYIKDLRVVDRPLDKMLLIDNAAYSYAFQIESGVPIIPFYDCKTDLELRHLSGYLKSLAQSKDIRREHCSNIRTNEYPRFQDPMQLIYKLYGEYIKN